MGSNEAIIYGDRHGEHYREITEDGRTVTAEHDYFPNGILVRSHGDAGTGVAIGVVRFDQESGNRLEVPDEDGQWDSLWADLDWNGCNRLIKAVREHRDRQFGKPE